MQSLWKTVSSSPCTVYNLLLLGAFWPKMASKQMPKMSKFRPPMDMNKVGGNPDTIMTQLSWWSYWDINYNSDKREPEFLIIFATWPLRLTLNSIWNSCNVYNKQFCETGKDHIGVQCKHRLERDDRRDDSQTLHGKAPAGGCSDKTRNRNTDCIFRITMTMHQKQLSAAMHITITMRSRRKVLIHIIVNFYTFIQPPLFHIYMLNGGCLNEYLYSLNCQYLDN